MKIACACAASRQVARVLTQLYDGHLRTAGIEAPQFALMMTLEQVGQCSQADLGRQYALDKTTVSRNLKVLESHGWIAPVAVEDRRRHEFTLTASGRAQLAAAKPKWKKAQNQLRSALGGEQWDGMFGVFAAVTQAALALQEEND